MTENWLPEPNYRLAAAAKAWMRGGGPTYGNALEGDHLALWLQSAPEGKLLRLAIAAYEAAQPIAERIEQAAKRGAWIDQDRPTA